MFNRRLGLLEDKFNYLEHKYGVLEDEAGVAWTKYGELPKVGMDIEREDLMDSLRGLVEGIIELRDIIHVNIDILQQSGEDMVYLELLLLENNLNGRTYTNHRDGIFRSACGTVLEYCERRYEVMKDRVRVVEVKVDELLGPDDDVESSPQGVLDHG